MEPAIDICLFSYRAAPTSALMAIRAMVDYTEAQGISCKLWIYGNALIHRARNEALAKMRREATHVLFIDDDMFPSPDALCKLLMTGLPVVSALCTTRSHDNPTIAAKVYDPQKDCFGAIGSINLTRFVTGPFAPGTGFLLMDRETVDRLIEHHLRAEDWLCEHLRMLNRLRVRSEQREVERIRLEKLRRGLAAKGIIRVFDYPVNEEGLQLGEDVCLGRKLLDLQIPVSIDGTNQVGHIGEYPYGIWDVIAKEERQQEEIRS